MSKDLYHIFPCIQPIAANLGEIPDTKGMVKMFRGQFLSQWDKEETSHYILTTNFNNVKKKKQSVFIQQFLAH